jgi:exonuclease VII large subunit
MAESLKYVLPEKDILEKLRTYHVQYSTKIESIVKQNVRARIAVANELEKSQVLLQQEKQRTQELQARLKRKAEDNTEFSNAAKRIRQILDNVSPMLDEEKQDDREDGEIVEGQTQTREGDSVGSLSQN